jgi:gluconolactonase
MGKIIQDNEKLERLAKFNFKFTEGPAVDRDGNIFFTDQPNNLIFKWSVEGELSVFLNPSGRSNGLYLDNDGNIIACADNKNELWSITPDGKITVLIKDYQGKLLNGPNDVWVRPDNGIYFSDPFYSREYWEHRDKEKMEQDGQHVYYIIPNRKTINRVTNDLNKPNGLIGTPDGKTLYIADIGDGKTYAYDIQQDGSLVNKRLFCNFGSDGMTIDNEGNVYLTGNGVTVFDKNGTQIEHIIVPEGWTSNVTFGGKYRNLLFITASKGIYGLKMNVKGV